MGEDKKQINNSDGKKLETLQTYMSDMADVIRDKEISLVKIVSAEQKRRERGDYYQKGNDTTKKKTFYIFGGVIFIVITIIISYLLIQKTKKDKIPPKIITVAETPISYDNKIPVDIFDATNKNDLSSLIDPILKNKERPETIKEISLIETLGGKKIPLSIKKLLSILNISAPGLLTRSFSDKYMLGVYTPPVNYSQNSLFLIIKIKDYDRAYSGMLEWEKTIVSDLFGIFHIDISGPNKELFYKPFKDIIIKNKDVRVLYNSSGVDALYYLFANKNTLVISTSQNAIKEIISRILIKETKPI